VHLATGARVDGAYSYMALETRARIWANSTAVYAAQAFDEERTEVLARWVEEMRSFATSLNAHHGSIFVMPYDAVQSEATMVGTVRNFVLQHPYPEQFERMARVEKYLGDKYVGFPRWGTLLSHEHIAALGGLEKIQQHVQPALVAPCGAGLYFQLTDSVATAMSAEALAKQEKFIELAQPLLPPPLLPP